MDNMITRYLGRILIIIVAAGVISSIGLWGQVQVLQKGQDSLVNTAVNKELVDSRINSLMNDVTSLKVDITKLREAQVDAEVNAAKRGAKLDLILEQLKK